MSAAEISVGDRALKADVIYAEICVGDNALKRWNSFKIKQSKVNDNMLVFEKNT